MDVRYCQLSASDNTQRDKIRPIRVKHDHILDHFLELSTNRYGGSSVDGLMQLLLRLISRDAVDSGVVLLLQIGVRAGQHRVGDGRRRRNVGLHHF